MIPPPLHPNEDERLAILRRCGILDTAADPDFDGIVDLASAIAGTPIALVSLVDEKRQWLKARHGLNASETPRDLAFCAYAILNPSQPFVIPNAHLDPRFVGNPLVENPPHVTFYAGIPLTAGPDHLPVGTLCVIDQKPRTLTPEILTQLKTLARQVEILIDARLRQLALEEALVLAEARKQEDQLLAKVAAQVTGMVYQFLLRPDGSISFPYSSQGILDIYGVTPIDAAISAQEVVNRLHPEDRDRVMATIADSAQHLTRWTCVYRYCHPDGVVRWLQGQSTPERLSDGGVLWHGFITDVGEKKGLEELLQQSSRMTEHAVRTAGLFQSMIDQHTITSMTNADGMIQNVNDAFCSISGYRREELIGQNHRIINSGHHGKKFWESMWGIVLSGKPWRGEVCNKAKDGSLYWVDSIIAPFTNSDGHIDRIMSIRFDITARKKAEKELSHVTQRLSLALSGGDVGTWDYDLVNNILVWDKLMYRLYGITSDQFGGAYEAWHSCVYPDDKVRVGELIRIAVAGGPDYDTEFRITHPDGQEHYIRGRGVVHRDENGKPLRMIGTNWDVTESRRQYQELQLAKEQAEAASKAKAEFLAMMSHEIRTPMNGVIGMTNLLVKTNLDSQQREYAETVRSCGESLLTLINDILDFSKLEAGRVELESIPFSPAQIIEEVVLLFTSQAEEKGLVLNYNLPNNLPARLLGDPTRIRQVLLNLVSNALKFTLKGSVSLEVTINHIDVERLQFAVAVRDTGIGMTPAQIARLGEAFTQADSSTTRRFGGSGLGMTISKAIIHLMNGVLQVESKPDQGSVFRVELPLPVALSLSTENAVNSICGRLVLCVDNQSSQLTLMENMCRSWGMVVETFTTAQELMVRLRTNGKIPDFVLTSHEMSGIDGIMLARLLMADTRLPALSIIIASHNPDQARYEIKNISRSYVIEKPLLSSQLLTAVQQALTPSPLIPDNKSASIPSVHLQRVLVAEDVRVNQRLIMVLLKDVATTVDLVENGLQAVAAVEKNHYDCVLMDCQMPEMDGYEATKNIRDREQRLGLPRLPIIALTAHAMQGAREHCLAAGMDDYLSKPLRENDLQGLLIRHFGQRSSPTINKVQPTNDPITALRSMLGEQDIRDVAQAVVDEYPRLLADIDRASEVGDSSRVARIGHSFKGSGAGLEMNELQEAARMVEMNAKKSSRENLVPMVEKLKREAERAITLFRNFLGGPR